METTHKDKDDGLAEFAPAVDLPLDPGIRQAVLLLRQAGVETFESCEGGPGHAFDVPTIRFYGNAWSGHKAFAVAMEHDLPVRRIQRAYAVVDGELEGPVWEIVFHEKGLP
jgi:hypothetical protein